jgi:hypothetical protein
MNKKNGLTRSEILKQIPELRPGSFQLFALRAGLKKTAERPNKTLPHVTEFLYPNDSVEKLKMILKKTVLRG